MDTLDQYATDRKEVLKSQIEGVVSDLAKTASATRPTFPERYFVGIFLPYFAGDEKPPYPTMDLGAWVGRVAGSPFQEVDVIDPSGKVLFTVPPMLDRSAVDLEASQHRGQPIAHIVRSAQQLTLMSPRQGALHLQEKLTQKALIMKAPASVVRNIEAWNKIFERYGRPPMMAVPEDQSEAATASAGAPPLIGGDMELL